MSLVLLMMNQEEDLKGKKEQLLEKEQLLMKMLLLEKEKLLVKMLLLKKEQLLLEMLLLKEKLMINHNLVLVMLEKLMRNQLVEM
jgi:hypothetical protein